MANPTPPVSGALPRARGGEWSHPAKPQGRALFGLSLGALGVVYGDIGTSPLYALREAFHGPYAIAASRAHVLGVLSLVFWVLVVVICIKYLTLLLRFDHRGEGGILALLTLLHRRRSPKLSWAAAAGLLGATLLYGDGVITPAISVLGAVEGLAVQHPPLEQAIVPVALVVLVGLFALQRHGTARLGSWFGPIMLLWFLAIGTAGLAALVKQPGVLAAINPGHALAFLTTGPPRTLLVIGAVVLVVTGGEALYADLGHFGRRPIRLAWYSVVLPALLLNYFGQGALLLERPEAAVNPFFLLVPRPLVLPMVVLATSAAIIASQALISGSFSLTRQLVQLGYAPPTAIVHTSAAMPGQIYVPGVATGLFLGCVALVLLFGGSSGLAAAYGIAVMGTAVLTTFLASLVAHELLRIRWRAVLAVALPLAAVELVLLAANLPKVASGGWVPIAIAAVLCVLMSTWKWGRSLLAAEQQDTVLRTDLFLGDLERRGLPRVPGTAAFLTRQPEGIPRVLLHYLKHNPVLHERVILLTVVYESVPRVLDEERFEVAELGQGLHRMSVRYGFMESPDLPRDLAAGASKLGIALELQRTSFFLGRETILPTGGRLARLRKRLYALMQRNARPMSHYFRLPANRVVELGAQIEI